jgi:outer membrane protein TolC
VRQFWYDLVFIEKSLQVNDILQTMVSQILKVTENRYATGKGLQQEVLAAQVELSELLDERINLKSRKQMLQGRLGSLLNRAHSFTESGIEEPFLQSVEFDIAHLNELALNRNPRLLERYLQVEKAQVEVELAQKAYMPDMIFQAGYGQRENDPVTGNDRSDFFSTSVSFTLPLWQNTRQDSKLAATEKRLAASEKSAAGLVASLPHQIDGLIGEIEGAVENYNLFKDALTTQAGLLAASSLAAYSVGKVEFGTMLTSRIRTVRYELKAESYKFQALKKLAELDELTGEPGVLPIGGYEEENHTESLEKVQ